MADHNFMLSCHSYFFNGNEFQDFHKALEMGDVEEFHKFMEKLISDNENTIKCMQDTNLDTEKYMEKMMNSIATSCVWCHTSKSLRIFEVLLTDYKYVLSDAFLKYHIGNQITLGALIFLSNRIDLRKYLPEIRSMFWGACSQCNIQYIKKFTGLGFTVQELSESSDNNEYRGQTVWFYALQNDDETVIEFLLENHIDFKKYEFNILRDCIFRQKIKSMKIFIGYGINVSVLNKLKEENFKKTNVELYKLLIEHNIEPMTAALLQLEH